jgi:hypothetical protein
MSVVRIEHKVASFEEWKKLFDGDPLGREQGGVRAHRVLRDREDPDSVMIDLVFDDVDRAKAFRTALQELWGRVEIMAGADARIAELVEQQEYGAGA